MFIINPDPYSLPCYRIGPFTTKDLTLNCELPESNDIDSYFVERFREKEYIYTYNGREAINIALSNFKLQKDDIVTIHTTSDNFYISGCVTREIEKFCKWSRKIESNTKLFFVNHEFGYPYKNLLTLRATGLPIIEDCAHSFFSHDEDNTTGTIGNYVIYSFPKMFPIQIGGLLVNNTNQNLKGTVTLNKTEKRYIRNVLSYYIHHNSEMIEKRMKNYNTLSKRFSELGFAERFTLSKGIVPGVFMFCKGYCHIDLPELKKFYYAHGIHCSVFYGEEAFYIPIHQALNELDLEYFFKVMKAFIKQSEL
jgi:hypothetical protein